MDLTQTIVNALVVGVVGAILGWMVHGLRTEVTAEIGGLRAEVRKDIAGFRAEVREDFRDLRREMAEMRSDLTHVALAVGAKRPAAGQ